MVLFAFKEDSILNTPFVRVINAIVLVVVFLVYFLDNEGEMPIQSYRELTFIAFFSAFCISFSCERTLNRTTFFEEEERERKKKESFIFSYLMVNSLLSIFLGIAIVLCYEAYINLPTAGFILFLAPVLLITFNILNIPSLFYPIFEKDLSLR